MDEGSGFKFDSENFIDPGAKRNYGNEPGALKRSFTVVIVSRCNPSYLGIKLTYIYMDTHTHTLLMQAQYLHLTHTHTHIEAKSLVVG